MPDDFDDFLGELRTQVVRSAHAAARETRPAARRQPTWLTMPRPAFVAAAVVVVALATGVALAPLLNGLGGSHSTPAQLPPSGPGPRPSPALVLPFTPTTSPSPGVSAMPGSVSYSLWAVAARSATDVWAVGGRDVLETGRPGVQTSSFILHWDGVEWRETPSPDVGTLRAVATTADGDAWALGPTGDAILRWDGTRWTVAARGVPAGGCLLDCLAVVGGREPWLAGSVDGESLAMRWDGFSWRAVDLPPGAGFVREIAGSSPTDVWAVGSNADGSQGMVLHYDGAVWTTDTAAAALGALGAVAAPSATDVWVAGAGLSHGFWHFDGLAWASAGADAPAVAAGPMSAPSAADIWATGADQRSVVHWDGDAWGTVDTAGMGLPDGASFTLAGVTALAGGDVWVVGTIGDPGEGVGRPLVVRGGESGWRVEVDLVEPATEE